MQILVMLGFFLAGAAAVLHGVALLSPAGAWIVAGIFCLAIALWPVVRRG